MKKRMKIGKEVRIPKFNCLECNAPLDACFVAGKGGNVRPKVGDLSLCVYCGHLAVYAEGGTLRQLTGRELLMVAADPRILEAQRARRVMRKHPRAKNII